MDKRAVAQKAEQPVFNLEGSGSIPDSAFAKRDSKAEMKVVNAYAEKFGHERIDTFLAAAEQRSWWLNWTWPERLKKEFGPLGEAK